MPYSATQLNARRATIKVAYPDPDNVYTITYRQGLLVNRSEEERAVEGAAENAVLGQDAEGTPLEDFKPDTNATRAYYAGLVAKYVHTWDMPSDEVEGATLPLSIEAITATGVEVPFLQIVIRDICRDATPKVIAPSS